MNETHALNRSAGVSYSRVLRGRYSQISAGERKSRLYHFETETVSAKIEPRHGATPYVRWGNYPVVSGALLLVGILSWRVRIVSRQR